MMAKVNAGKDSKLVKKSSVGAKGIKYTMI